MKKILIIEDDKAILRGLADHLTKEHFDVSSASDGIKGLAMGETARFDLVILDVMLPGMNGFEVCRELRRKGVQTPVLILTGKGEEVDKVLGLELGADDYVTKPFSVNELVARIRAILRRQSEVRTSIDEATVGDVHLDFRKQEATRGKRKLRLSSREFQLLKYFIEHEGEVISRARLLDDVWGFEATPTTRTVDNFILSLRKKIETNPSSPIHLLTVHTSGYKFVL